MERHMNGHSTNGAVTNGNHEKNSLYYEFYTKSELWGTSIDSADFAKRLDEEDPLKEYRDLYHYPKKKDFNDVNLSNISDANEECIYFCGHSLGLQVKLTKSKVEEALDNWAIRGVDCHLKGDFSALFSDQIAKEQMARLVGAEINEIAFMNGLTVNIHLMLASFYRPTEERHKILMLDGGFHSDLYALQSHVALRGFDPQDSLIFLKPKQDKHTLDLNDILSVIKEEGKDISLIFLEGVHYYSGQRFDLEAIAEAGHAEGCIVGYDLAHGVGNMELQLHDWNVDFAVWCTYKYLNSGPGNMGAIFCHSKHTQGSDQVVPMLRGWWGLDTKRKFTFDKDFTPAGGADRFKLSNPSPLLCAMISASIDVFNQAGMDKIQEKQRLLTGYLEYLLRKHIQLMTANSYGIPQIEIITPQEPTQRGSQISLLSSVPVARCEKLLKAEGIVCDIREPSVIRITPAPLYNTFTEVHKFVHTFKNIWQNIQENGYPEK